MDHETQNILLTLDRSIMNGAVYPTLADSLLLQVCFRGIRPPMSRLVWMHAP
jgi:hypothetical protein